MCVTSGIKQAYIERPFELVNNIFILNKLMRVFKSGVTHCLQCSHLNSYLHVQDEPLHYRIIQTKSGRVGEGVHWNRWLLFHRKKV